MAGVNSIPAFKKCSVCGDEKPATTEFFHPNTGGKYGLRAQCRPCRQAAVRESIKRPEVDAARKALAARYVLSGEYAEQKRRWREKNIEKARASTAAYKARNPEATRLAALRWREENRDKARAKQRRADAVLQTKPIHVLNKRIKGRIREMFRGAYQPGTIGKHLEFTKAELLSHIERQFTAGMTWARLVAGEIHVDHIVPIAAFDIKEIGDSEFRACWALGNLRPMWAVDNWSKQAKVETLL